MSMMMLRVCGMSVLCMWHTHVAGIVYIMGRWVHLLPSSKLTSKRISVQNYVCVCVGCANRSEGGIGAATRRPPQGGLAGTQGGCATRSMVRVRGYHGNADQGTVQCLI